MQLTEMQQKLKEFEEYNKTFESQFKYFLNDESIPLHIRWNLFCESDLGTIDSYIPHLPELDTLLKNLSPCRLETLNYAYLVEDMLEYDVDGNITGIQEETIADIIIKFALKYYYKGFKYDW